MLDKYHGLEFSPLYSTSVKVTGTIAAPDAASCIAQSEDGKLDVELRLPSVLGGPGGTTPEQLFAAGFAACFYDTLKLLGNAYGLRVDDAAVDVAVTFGRDPVDGLYALQSKVSVQLPSVPSPTAEELIRNAERVCPYAKMTRQGIDCVISLVRA